MSSHVLVRKTHWSSLLTVALVIGSVSAACSEGEGTGSTCPQGSTLTYESFGQSFMKSYCLSCHSNAGRKQSPLFETVEQIRARKTDIDRLAASGPNATNEEMPDEGSCPTAERKKLGEWLACGAP